MRPGFDSWLMHVFLVLRRLSVFRGTVSLPARRLCFFAHFPSDDRWHIGKPSRAPRGHRHGAAWGIETRTSRTRNENHAIEPSSQLGVSCSQASRLDCHGKAQARSRVSSAHPCYHCFRCVLARGGCSASGLDFFQLTSRLPWQAAARPSTTACVGHAAQHRDLSTCVGRATTARVA